MGQGKGKQLEKQKNVTGAPEKAVTETTEVTGVNGTGSIVFSERHTIVRPCFP